MEEKEEEEEERAGAWKGKEERCMNEGGDKQ